MNTTYHNFRPEYVPKDKQKAEWDTFYHKPRNSDHLATHQEMLSLDATERYFKQNDIIQQLHSQPSVKQFFGNKYNILTGFDETLPEPPKSHMETIKVHKPFDATLSEVNYARVR